MVGVGYWGPNIIRNFATNPSIRVEFCADLNQERLDYIRNIYPYIKTTTDYKDIVKNQQIDLIAICTPVYTHYEIAKAALLSGKHVLIEKPMTSKSFQAEELINIAEQKNLKIFVDHTFIFTDSVKKIKEIIDSEELGDLYYFDSVRINLGLFQHDINVLWDLAPHDISIMYYLLNKMPESVVATGSAHLGNGIEDVAYMTIFYTDNLIAHIHTNWLSPVKIRQTLIAGSKKMIVWDDNQPSEKVRIYNKGIDILQDEKDIYRTLIQYRTGDMYAPKLDGIEALTRETQNIVNSIMENRKPLVDGFAGWMVVKVLEAADQSIKNRGKEIKIEDL